MKKLTPPPNVDSISFNPKFKCGPMAGYQLSEIEVAGIRTLVDFIVGYKDMFRTIDLTKVLARLENSLPMDDASLLSPGDALLSLGEHSSNPLEDIVTIARIWKLASHIINEADASYEELLAMDEEEALKDVREMAEESERRRAHFARNLNSNTQLNSGIGGRVGKGNYFDQQSVDAQVEMVRGALRGGRERDEEEKPSEYKEFRAPAQTSADMALLEKQIEQAIKSFERMAKDTYNEDGSKNTN